MKTDRELLELAAKAAGIAAHWGDGWQADMMFRAVPRPNSPLVSHVEWNPLTDDGDALRLAVALRLDLLMDGPGIQAPAIEARANTGSDFDPFAIEELDTGDPYAATRRAIVRAAAEIGASA